MYASARRRGDARAAPPPLTTGRMSDMLRKFSAKSALPNRLSTKVAFDTLLKV